ncbi:MAG: methyl-accepting chemotaxis protein [ANME-2 cluster archaeon]|nr:methyl-accepting chemotaxis protein [ANME-2 cluster archaeon]
MTISDMINDMPIGRKLFIGFGIVALLLIAVGYVGVSGLNMAGNDVEVIANTHTKLLEEASHLEIAMLQARRSEKDFLMRMDTSYISKVNNQVDDIVEDAQLIQQLDITTKQRNDAREIESLAKEYGVLFNQVANLYIERGLTEDSGLQGDSRDATHEIEAVIEEKNIDGSINQLQVDMLQMRRNEKDYLARLDVTYQTQLHDNQKLFLQHLEDSSLSQVEKDQIKRLLNAYVSEFDKIVKMDAEITSKTNEFRDKSHLIEPIIEGLQTEAVLQIDIENAKALEEMAAAKSNMIIISIVALIMAVIAALIITRSITKPVDEMIDVANRIAAGDLSVDITNISKDEIGTLAKAMGQMKNVILSVVSDINQLVEYTLDGKLDARADASTYKGDYADIITGVNNTLDAVIGPLNMAAEYIDRISKGDIPGKITDEYKGDFNEIKNNLNLCIDAIDGMVADVNTLVEYALEGQLDTRADASKHGGDFFKIINGINETLDAFVGPMNMAAEYIDRIASGDLPEKISDEYKGDFNEIKNNLNTCIDAINEMVDDVNMLAEAVENGKLYVRADTSKHEGDFKTIVQGMNDTLNALAEPMQIASDVAIKLASSAQELASSAQQMNATTESVASTVQQIAKGTQSQSIQIGNTSKTMESMATIVKEVASKSQSAADISVNASKIAQKGSEAAGNAAVKMNDIQKVVSESGAVVKELGGRSQEIGEIVQMITGIANQTNLLALNAAIEAARAGEAGRGFAVVADEVRNLAEESKQAADKIAVLIKEIQSETDKAVVSMESGTTEVEEGAKIVNEALTALENIAAGSQEVANVILEISAATEEQKSGIENVVKAIDEIAAVAEESAAGTEEASGATEEQTAAMEEVTSQAQDLANMGVELQRALERFTLREKSR